MNTDGVAQPGFIAQPGLLQQRLLAEWQALLCGPAADAIAPVDLLTLWSRCKFVVLAHDERIYRQIGPLLANLSGDVRARAEQALELMLLALSAGASRAGHVNALQHVAGFVRQALSVSEKQAWLRALGDYQAGLVALSVPATLLLQQLQQYGGDYVRAQHYPRWFVESDAAMHAAS